MIGPDADVPGIGWRTGSATAAFPIPEGTPLGGYMARTSGATGTLDPLQIGVLHLEAAGRSLTMVTADVIGVDAELRDRIAFASDLDPDTVLLAASHTHSGPQAIVRRLHPIEREQSNDGLRDRFVAIAAECVRRARAGMVPVSLGLCDAEAAGGWLNRNREDGPNDNRLRMLVTTLPDGQIQTVVVHTAVHPTVLGAESTVVSADLSGGIRREIHQRPAAAGAAILSLTGAAGDISTRFTRRDSTPAAITDLAGKATSQLPETDDSRQVIPAIPGSLRHRRLALELPSFREDLSSDPARDVEVARIAREAAQAGNVPPAALRQAITRHQGAILRMQMMTAPEPVAPPPVTLDAWALNEQVAILAMPVELFTSLGARIEAMSPFLKTIIVGYANGYAGYVADSDAWDAGTYEALASPFARRAGNELVDAAQTLLEVLHGEVVPQDR